MRRAGTSTRLVGCLRSLDAPHYHHELTKRALLAAFEKPDQAPALLALLRRLADTGVVSQVMCHSSLMYTPQGTKSSSMARWHLLGVSL